MNCIGPKAHLIAFALGWCIFTSVGLGRGAQEKIPSPPADTTQIYVAAAGGELAPLPVEAGTSSLNVNEVAGRDRKGFVELNGAMASYSTTQPNPRIYLFVARGPNVHPAFVVRLASKGGKRRLPIQVQKGLGGFAVPTEHIVIPHYRVLSAVGDLNFLEVTPRFPLVLGEYAVVGEDLKRIATFRVVASSTN